jgi:transposase
VFAGLDWGGSFHQLCLLDEHGDTLLQRRISHDVAGFAELDGILSTQPQQVRIAIERAEGLLVEYLHTLELKIYCLSPKISARARERYRLAAAKSDAFDAFVLADTLRHEHGHWRPLSPPSPLLAELRAITRDRERVVIAQRATENRLRAVLEAYHPAPLHLFSTLDRDISLAFITNYPTPRQAERVGTARMAAFCGRQGHTGRTQPAVLVERLRPHLLSASAGTIAGKTFSANAFGEQLRLLNKQLRAYDKRLAELLAQHPDTPIFTSFPGIGPISAGVLISEMGEDRTRFPAPGALLAETGLAPVTRASGRTRQVRFRYAANHRMRHAIDWWMFTATREDTWSRQSYDAARAAGQGKYRALRGLGARWTRILWRCWTHRTTYDPAIHHKTEQPK